MKYATDHAFRTALEARIKQVQSDSAGVSRVRKRIVFERLLARLVAQASGEWVLKGGFALELRLGNVARSTKDADFEWRLDEEDAVELLLDAAALDIGDRFTFALERSDEETDLPGGGQRWRVAATLAGRIFERTVIDVAFAAPPVQAPDRITTSGLLDSPVSAPSRSRRSRSSSTSRRSSTPTPVRTRADDRARGSRTSSMSSSLRTRPSSASRSSRRRSR
jgi:hypothetical protein